MLPMMLVCLPSQQIAIGLLERLLSRCCHQGQTSGVQADQGNENVQPNLQQMQWGEDADSEKHAQDA